MSKEMENKLVPKLRFPEFEKEWEESTFGKAAKFINGRAYKQEELLESGKYRVLRVGNFFSNNKWYYSNLELEEDKYCDNGDLLYAWSASFGPRIWMEEKVIYHYHIWKVSCNKGVKKSFLFNLLDCETQKMKSQSANGFALLHITKGTIEAWKCLIPKSEVEQQKIADCLSSLDDLITAESEKLDALKEHKRGLMQNLFPVEGEKLPKLRFPEFKDSGQWEEDKFENAVNIIDGDRGLNYPKADEFSKSGFCIFLNAKNVTKQGFAFDSLQFISKEKDDVMSKGKLKRLDIILTTRGSVGQFAYYNENIPYEHMRINSGMVILRANSNLVLSDFLFEFCKSELITSFVINNAFGNAQKQLTVSLIKKLPIQYPLDKIEQQKIANCLSSLDEQITVQTQKIEDLKLHKKGLMQQLFPSIN